MKKLISIFFLLIFLGCNSGNADTTVDATVRPTYLIWEDSKTGGKADNHTIYFRDDETTYYVTVPDEINKYLLKDLNLDSDTLYEIWITSSNSAGESDSSNIIVYDTGE
jgi:hypothetical protein